MVNKRVKAANKRGEVAKKSCEVESKVERPLKKVTEGTGIS
ncbi:hypothetical protein [Neobacillus niacini]|nr:hypothetical protein [Neobacillus niacini]MDR6999355.1 hypothetical protein [Neobacillus niacini]